MSRKMKKIKTNAFMEFTKEWQLENGDGIGMEDAIDITGKIWPTMSEEDREPYRLKAQKINGRGSNDSPSPSQVKQMKKEIYFQQSLSIIEQTVQRSLKIKQFENQVYYFAKVNYFLKMPYSEIYLPAEISIAKFSLKQGVITTYHSFISPKVDTFAFSEEIQEHTSKTHQLPVPPKALGSTNLYAIYKAIIEFVRDPATDHIPPLYTHVKEMDAVNSVLDYLKRGKQKPICLQMPNLDVYSIQYLLYIMTKATYEETKSDKIISQAVTDKYFAKDCYASVNGFGCKYHESKDRSAFCTLSYVTRWGFLFSSAMCKNLLLPLIPGKHIPLEATAPTRKLLSELFTSLESNMSDLNLDNADSDAKTNQPTDHKDTLTGKDEKNMYPDVTDLNVFPDISMSGLRGKPKKFKPTQ